MSGVLPRYALAEDALRLLVAAKVEFSQSRRVLGERPRIRPLGAHEKDADLVEESAAIRYVSIAEAFADAISMYRFSQVLDVSQRPLMQLLASFEVSSTGSWGSRHEVFKKQHGVDLFKLACWKKFDAAIQVRNCLAHGLGKLTARFRGSNDIAAKVQLLDVAVGGNAMHFGPSTLMQIEAVCRDFVVELDGKLDI